MTPSERLEAARQAIRSHTEPDCMAAIRSGLAELEAAAIEDADLDTIIALLGLQERVEAAERERDVLLRVQLEQPNALVAENTRLRERAEAAEQVMVQALVLLRPDEQDVPEARKLLRTAFAEIQEPSDGEPAA